MKRLAQDTTCVVDDPDRDLRPPFVVSLHHALSQDSSSSSMVRFFAGMPSWCQELEITQQQSLPLHTPRLCRLAFV